MKKRTEAAQFFYRKETKRKKERKRERKRISTRMSYPTSKSGKYTSIYIHTHQRSRKSLNHPNTLYVHSIGRKFPSETSEKEAPHLASRAPTRLAD